MAGRSYDTVDVPTVGGDIHVGRWPGGPHVVVAVHGVTFLHTEYHTFADQVGEDFTVLAPDLRGRGGSARLGPPFGLPTHADDIAAVLRHLGVRRSTVLGHSWGAAVALVTARRHPSLVDNLVLVDGGLPAEADPNAPQVAHNPPGAVVERLGTRYPTAEAYLEVWRAHPGLRRHWNPYLETHFRYELTGEEGQLHSSLREDAFLADVASYVDGDDTARALGELSCPATLVRAGRGMFDEEQPMQSGTKAARWQECAPLLRDLFVPDANHYTILFSEHGARAVADAVRKAVLCANSFRAGGAPRPH